MREKTINVCLIRCGETTWSGQQRLFGSTDLPLSPGGRASLTEDVAGIVPRKLGAIYHPPDEAATETAKLFASALSCKARPTSDLADPALGLLEGMTEREFQERYAKRYKQWHEDPLSLEPPQGETFTAARTRLFSAVTRVLRRTRSDEVGIVLHSLGLGMLRCWLCNEPGSQLWHVLEGRPRIERYILSPDMIDDLAATGEAELATGR